uniref:Uncharacterized protein n=1 Tax=Populus davidiana TaxID=266767 RepID=A0A6M2EZ07_9ROSI
MNTWKHEATSRKLLKRSLAFWLLLFTVKITVPSICNLHQEANYQRAQSFSSTANLHLKIPLNALSLLPPCSFIYLLPLCSFISFCTYYTDNSLRKPRHLSDTWNKYK